MAAWTAVLFHLLLGMPKGDDSAEGRGTASAGTHPFSKSFQSDIIGFIKKTGGRAFALSLFFVAGKYDVQRRKYGRNDKTEGFMPPSPLSYRKKCPFM